MKHERNLTKLIFFFGELILLSNEVVVSTE